MKRFEGICLGGPIAGEKRVSFVAHMRVPVHDAPDMPPVQGEITPTSPTPSRIAFYDFNAEQGCFVFQGYDR